MQELQGSEKEYIPPKSLLFGFIVLGPMFLLVLVIIGLVILGRPLSVSEFILLVFILIIPMLAALLLGLSWYSMKLVLNGNSITIINFFGQKNIPISGIEWTKVIYTKNGPMIILKAQNKKTTIPYIFSKAQILEIAHKIGYKPSV